MIAAIVQPCSCNACAEMADLFTLDGPQLSFIAASGLSSPFAGNDSPLSLSDAPAVAPAGVSDLRRPIGSKRSRRHLTGTGATP